MGRDSAIAHYSACVFGTPAHPGRPGEGSRSGRQPARSWSTIAWSRAGGHPRRAEVMIVARHFICLAIGFSLLVASACGGGGDELEKALQSLSEDDLAIMVLPQEAFGDASDGLDVASYSGVEDSDAVADDTLDPQATGNDLEDAGFVTGYSLNFEDPTFAALEEGKGVLDASSTVELFEDEAAAAAYLAKLLEDNRRFEGEEIEPGATLGGGGGFWATSARRRCLSRRRNRRWARCRRRASPPSRTGWRSVWTTCRRASTSSARDT